MEKFYLIYFSPEWGENKQVLLDRLAKLGPRVYLNETMYIVKSSLTGYEIYEKFLAPPIDNADKHELFITDIKPDTGNTFGLFNTDFWRFLGLYIDEKAKSEESTENKNKES